MAEAINSITGKLVSVPDHYIGHPVLGKNLKAVNAEAPAAPKKETKKKEQPAPEVSVDEAEIEINIEENEE